MAPSLEVAQEIIDCQSPFNKRESSVACMHDFYPSLLLVLMEAHTEEYSIPWLFG